MVAKGLLAGVCAPPEEKLKVLVPPPDPKEKGDPPFIPDWLEFELAPGKLCDCPNVKLLEAGWEAGDEEETVLGSRELKGPLKEAPGVLGVEEFGRRLRTSLIL